MRRQRHPFRSFTIVIATLGAFAVADVQPAGARPLPSFRAEVPLLDTIDVIVRRRSVIAVDPSVGFDVARAPLLIGEDVLWSGSRGRVGLVVTDKRVLAISTGAPTWHETRFRVRESLPNAVLLGDRVALVTTDDRIIGMAAGGGPLRMRDIGTHENLVDAVIGENLAIVITDKRVLGLSAFAGGFFQESVGIHEDFEYSKASANFGTVATDRRLLLFEATSGDWRTRRFRLDD